MKKPAKTTKQKMTTQIRKTKTSQAVTVNLTLTGKKTKEIMMMMRLAYQHTPSVLNPSSKAPRPQPPRKGLKTI